MSCAILASTCTRFSRPAQEFCALQHILELSAQVYGFLRKISPPLRDISRSCATLTLPAQ